MKQGARELALDILNRVEAGSFAEPLLDSSLQNRNLNDSDRRLLTSLVYGTLRMRGRLDWIIAKNYKGNFESLDTGLKNILRSALYQLLFADRIPEYAAVDEAVRIAKKKYYGRDKLINAVLRNAIRKAGEISYPDHEKEPAKYISVYHSHPLWIVERWIDVFGIEETAALCRANNEVPPFTLRVNKLKSTRESAIGALKSEGIAAERTRYSDEGVNISPGAGSIRNAALYEVGAIQIQDEASQLVSHLLAPKPQERILDMCSGVGGKATHIAELMGNAGEIIAIDIHQKKLTELTALAERLGISIILPRRADAARVKFEAEFDHIIIDAPCSGLGTLRRNPEIKWRLKPQDLPAYPRLQRNILANAGRLVKDGGTVVYSTCTNLPEENEKVVMEFLKENPEFKINRDRSGISAALFDSRGFFRTLTHLHGMDGFFAAPLVRMPG